MPPLGGMYTTWWLRDAVENRETQIVLYQR